MRQFLIPSQVPMMHEIFCLVLRLLGPVAACKLAAAWHDFSAGCALQSPGPSVPMLPCVRLWGAGVPGYSSLHCTCKQSELGLVVSLPLVI